MSQGLALAAPSAASAPSVEAPLGYFQRTLPVALILGAFLVLTIPLTFLALYYPDSPELFRLELVYLLGLGITHFVITPTIYLQSANLRYFNSTWRNRLIYFAIPVAIFAFFDLHRTLQLAVWVPLLDLP